MEQEGVIKFQLEFTKTAALNPEQILKLNAWRQVLVHLQMIGQTPSRYDNYGFGNISRRLTAVEKPNFHNPFVISGTQTGGLATLTAAHYATILHCDSSENRVVAEGPMRPSSESMTHGMVYALAPDVNWVFHAHDPMIWHRASALDIPTTGKDVPYGTPEMSVEVERLFRETAVSQKRIFAMAGHEDGIVLFGNTAEEAGAILLTYLAKAYEASLE